MAVYIEGHAESLVAATAEGTAGVEKLDAATTRLKDKQALGSKGFATYATTTKSATRATKEHEGATSKLSGTLKRAAVSGAAFVGAYAGFSVLESGVKYTEELVHQTQVLGSVTGMDSKITSQWIELAKQRGIQVTKLGMGFSSVSKQIRNAETGSTTAAKAFHNLGIPIKELEHMSTMQVIERIADGLHGMSNNAEKAALAQQFLGKSGREFLPILENGSGALRRQLGLFEGLTEKQQKQGEEAIVLQRKVGVAFDQLKIKATFAMLDIAKVISNPDMPLDKKIDYVMKKGSKALEKGITFLAGHMAERAPEVAEAFVKGFVNAPILGQAIFGTMLFSKLGGVGMLGSLFKKEGETGATALMGGMKKALPFALAAVGLDNIINSAVKGEQKAALYKTGGAIAGTIAGGIAGAFADNPMMGAMIGGGLGSILGGVVETLFKSDKKLHPLSERVAAEAKHAAQALKDQKTAVKNLATAQDNLAASNKRHVAATKNAKQAQSQYNAAVKNFGPNSDQAHHAAIKLAEAEHKEALAAQEAKNAHKQYGNELKLTQMKLRDTIATEKARIPGLNKTIEQLSKRAEKEPHNQHVLEHLVGAEKKARQAREGLTRAYATAEKVGVSSDVIHRWEHMSNLQAQFGTHLHGLVKTLTNFGNENKKIADIGGGAWIDYRGTIHHQTGLAAQDVKQSTSISRDAIHDMLLAIKGSSGGTEKYGDVTRRTMQGVQAHLLGTLPAFRTLDSGGVRAMTDLGGKLNAFLQAMGAKPAPFTLGKAQGGPVTVPGVGLQDTVPLTHEAVAAMVAPGEKLFVANRHQEPLIDRALANEYGVDGLEGFFTSFDKPHHMAAGGFVEPKLHGGTTPLRAGGQNAIHKAFKAVVKYYEEHNRYGRIVQNASRMDALHQPYLWGGGHGASASANGPWDCSGATSELFDGAGWNFAPMVSSGFMNWGLPGKGKVSVLASPDHVYSVLGDKGAFGTSNSNPGGGAGWISEYTFRPGFTIRHADLGSDEALKPFVGKRGKGDRKKKGFGSGGLVVTGKASYEGGTGHGTADGVHTDEDPGFAIRDDSTLGDWFWAKVGGAAGLLQHTDWGPAAWTGRAIDFTEAGLKKIGSGLSITDTMASVEWKGRSVKEASENLGGKTATGKGGKKSGPVTKAQKHRLKVIQHKAEKVIKETRHTAGEYKKEGGTKAGKRALERSMKLAKEAAAAHKAGNSEQAAKLIEESQKELEKARTAEKAASAGVFQAPLKPTKLLPSAHKLEPDIQEQLKSRGLTYAGETAIGERALERTQSGVARAEKQSEHLHAQAEKLRNEGKTSEAESVEATAKSIVTAAKGKEEDVLDFQKELLQHRKGGKKGLQAQLKKVEKELHTKQTKAQRKKSLAKKQHIEEELRGVEGSLESIRASKEELGESEEEDRQAQEEAQRQQEIIAQLETLNALQKEQSEKQVATIRLLESQSGPEGTIAKAITALVNGQIGGKVGLGFQTPSVAGSMASY